LEVEVRGEAMNLRDADLAEIDHLAKIWHDGWYDAHARIVPPGLAEFRTLESFRERLRAALPNVRVVGPAGAAAGFYIVKDDEVYQLYVSAQSRGSGIAAALIADAEARLHDAGFGTAWLACAVGNERAARFYEKAGWHRAGTREYPAETSAGEFILQVWRYEKDLGVRS
jgi:ribosomal protein S18 acetylase RimI-like enzyme